MMATIYKNHCKSLCNILSLVVAGILVEGGLDLEAEHLGMVYSCVTRVLVTSSEEFTFPTE